VIWAILALLGVPLWLCALGILTVVVQNRKLRGDGARPAAIPAEWGAVQANLLERRHQRPVNTGARDCLMVCQQLVSNPAS